jgi:hypothetical protein
MEKPIHRRMVRWCRIHHQPDYERRKNKDFYNHGSCFSTVFSRLALRSSNPQANTTEAAWRSALRPQTSVIRFQAFPQQLPGPAQPAWPGDDPQQAVSPGPGMAVEVLPDRDEWADMSFLILPLPQRWQNTVVFSVDIRISATWPQSVHKKSKIGMRPSFCPQISETTIHQWAHSPI